jgi:hypothetical protein
MNNPRRQVMSTANVSATAEQLLKSFDLLPQKDKHVIAYEIMRRAFPSAPELDDAQFATLYAEFADADRNLAEEGIEDYEIGLVSEDAG